MTQPAQPLQTPVQNLIANNFMPDAIPYGRQSISEADIEAVCEVLRSPWLTQGPAIEAFEAAVAHRCQARYAIAFSSATAALHACYATAFAAVRKPNPTEPLRLWTVPNTFVATANAALYCETATQRVQVDFVDIDPVSYNMSVAALERKLALAKENNTLPHVVVPVHFAGQSCDMAALHALSARYCFTLIEDASHAMGAQYLGQPVGNGAYSTATVFSFHPVKVMTTGEGGMVVTNHAPFAQACRAFRSHGLQKTQQWHYEQHSLGYNYRMTDLQAALGLSQLTRLDAFVNRRHQLAQVYQEAFANHPDVRPPLQLPSNRSALHLYPIQVPATMRQGLYEHLKAQHIHVQVHYIPVHTQPYYQAMGFGWGQYPAAEQYYQKTLSLPLFPELSEPQQQRVIQAVLGYF